MKKVRILSVLACSAILAGGALVSCGETKPAEEGKTITLTVSGPADKADYDKTYLEAFKEWRKSEGDKNTYVFEQVAHGEDKVDSEVTDWSSGPDVYAFASDKIQTLFQAGALAQLGGSYKSFVTSSNSETAVQGATFNGGVYAFPYTGDNTYYLQYDKTIFSAEDVKTVEGILAKCKEKGVNFYYNVGEGFYGAGAMFTFGADYNITFTEEGQISKIDADFDGSKGLLAAKGILKMVSDSSFVNEYAYPGKSEKAAICVAGTWDINNAKTALGDKYACAPMPSITVDGKTEELGCFVGCKLIGVNPQRSNGDEDRLNAALMLAQWLSDETIQEKRFDDQGTAPSNNAVAKLSKVSASENIATLVKQGEWGHAQGAVPSGIWSAPGTLVGGMIDGTITESNLEAAVKAYNDSVKASQ